VGEGRKTDDARRVPSELWRAVLHQSWQAAETEGKKSHVGSLLKERKEYLYKEPVWEVVRLELRLDTVLLGDVAGDRGWRQERGRVRKEREAREKKDKVRFWVFPDTTGEGEKQRTLVSS
jgi:hypothetical protein